MTNSTIQYECKIEQKSPIRRELTISVLPDSIQNYFEREFNNLKSKAKIKGFRQGKVPLPIIKQYYGDEVKSEVFSKVIQDSYLKAVEDNKLDVVGTPSIQPNAGHELNEGQTLVYVANIEIFPELPEVSFSKIKVTKPADDCSDEDVAKSIEELRKAHAEVVLSPDYSGPAKKDDFLEISFSGSVEGKSDDALTGKNVLIQIGSGRFLKDFEDALIGMKKGDVKKFELTFPQDYQSGEKKLAGKLAEFEVTVHEFKIQQLPEIDDEFAKRFDFETASELKKKIEENLKQSKKNDAQKELRNRIIDALIENTTFEVPEYFIKNQVDYLINDSAKYLKRQGFTEKMIQDYLMNQIEPYKTRAEKQVRFTLLMDKIVKDQAIQITEKDLEAEFAKIAQREELTLERVQEIFKTESSRKELELQIKEERVFDFILSQIKVKSE